MAHTARYFTFDVPAGVSRPVLARLEPGKASVFRSGAWEESAWAYGRVTGLAGDTDFDEVTLEQARALVPAAFPNEDAFDPSEPRDEHGRWAGGGGGPTGGGAFSASAAEEHADREVRAKDATSSMREKFLARVMQDYKPGVSEELWKSHLDALLNSSRWAPKPSPLTGLTLKSWVWWAEGDDAEGILK